MSKALRAKCGLAGLERPLGRSRLRGHAHGLDARRRPAPADGPGNAGGAARLAPLDLGPGWRRALPLAPGTLALAGRLLRGQPFYPLGQIPYGELFAGRAGLHAFQLAPPRAGPSPPGAWRYQPVQRAVAVYVVLGALLWCGGPKEPRYALLWMPAACLWGAHGVMEVELWAASKGWTYAWRILILLGLFLGAAQSLLVVSRDQNLFGTRRWACKRPKITYRNRGCPRLRPRPGSAHVPWLERGSWCWGMPGPLTFPWRARPRAPMTSSPSEPGRPRPAAPKTWVLSCAEKGMILCYIAAPSGSGIEDPAQPFYWSRDDAVTEQRVNAWLQSLAMERPHLILKRGAGSVFFSCAEPPFDPG